MEGADALLERLHRALAAEPGARRGQPDEDLQPPPARGGKPELVFTWLEIELQGGRLVVRMRLDSTCGIDPRRASG